MNKDIFEGKWKQVRGQVKEWWGQLTDDDLERVGGKFDQFVGVLQEKYGYTRERAEEEIDKRVAEHEAAEQEEEINQRVAEHEVHQKEAEIRLRAAEHDANPPEVPLPIE